MRGRLVLALLLVAIAAPALAQDGRLVERAGWTQFLPEWQMGPATFAFGDRNISVGEWTTYATDGSSWLYGSNETPERLQTPREGCAPADNVTAVVVTSYACSFAQHPSIVCAGVRFCDEATGEPVALATPTVGSRPSPTDVPEWGLAEPTAPTPTQDDLMGPDCRMLSSARCTPGPGAGLAMLALMGGVLMARRRA